MFGDFVQVKRIEEKPLNLSSRQVMSMGFALMLLLLLLITATGISNMAAINERLNKIVSVHNVKTNQIGALRIIARERSLLIYHMILDRDPFVVDEEVQQMSLLAGQFLKIRDQISSISMTNSEKQQFEHMLKVVFESTRIQQQVVDLLKEGRFDEAGRLLQEKSLAEQDKALKQYDAMLKTQHLLAEGAAQEARDAYHRSFVSMVVLSGMLIVLGSAVSVYIIKKISRSERSLHELNLNLEHRIKERTQALSEVNLNLQGSIQALRDTQNQLVQAEKMASLGNLVAGISHEINTPLGIGVTSASSLQEEIGNLQKRFADGSMKRSDLENFFTHANQASSILINNMERASSLIRSFKQVAVDQASDDWREVNFHNYYEEILTSLRPKLKPATVTVENCAEEGLQSHTQPGAIYQIISNLILNAMLHAYEPGQPGTIRIGARRDGEQIELSCQDDGKGIADENLGRIFEPFFTTRRGSGGTGLGLNIVYNLVTTQLGGKISVSSKTGSGTVFTIRLPIRRQGESA